MYLIQKIDNSFTAFVGSSNTTNWGLEKNVEMNFQINDQVECKKLLNWFNALYINGYIITQGLQMIINQNLSKHHSRKR